jgi:hypothetical protein
MEADEMRLPEGAGCEVMAERSELRRCEGFVRGLDETKRSILKNSSCLRLGRAMLLQSALSRGGGNYGAVTISSCDMTHGGGRLGTEPKYPEISELQPPPCVFMSVSLTSSRCIIPPAGVR